MPLITRFVFASELVVNLSPEYFARANERPQVQGADLSYTIVSANVAIDALAANLTFAQARVPGTRPSKLGIN
jgi:hypothetical protein